MATNDMVKTWIAENFDLNAVKIFDFPLLPGGCRVVDKRGKEICVYYDILKNKVKWFDPD